MGERSQVAHGFREEERSDPGLAHAGVVVSTANERMDALGREPRAPLRVAVERQNFPASAFAFAP
jgi:hypothetical protein